MMKMTLAFAAVMMATVSYGQKKEEPKKALVLYYSQTTNTKKVAQEIASRLGADLEEVVAVKPYDGDFQATINRSMKERQEGVTPDIKPLKADLSKYDVIFLGYPIWFGTYAPPVITLLNQIDLAGKKVVPFCTFGSGGLEASIKDLSEKQPKAELLAGYGVRAARLDAMPKEVEQFLIASGFLKGTYTPLKDFGTQQPVSAEQSAIFDAAVGDYPMISAKAKTVASRPIPGGTEYLFYAEDLPRGNAPQAPSAGQMQVYVTVLNGSAPVFTRVNR